MDIRKGFKKEDIPEYLPKSNKDALKRAIEQKEKGIKKEKDTKELANMEALAKVEKKGAQNTANAKILKTGEKYLEDTKNLMKDFIIGEQKHLPIDVLLKYKKAGITNQGIAKLTGLSTSTVQIKLAPYRDEIKALDVFKQTKIDQLNLIQRRLLLTMSQEEIDTMTPKERGTLFGILFDKTRIEEGKPTNTVVNHFNFLQRFASPSEGYVGEGENSSIEGEFVEDE